MKKSNQTTTKALPASKPAPQTSAPDTAVPAPLEVAGLFLNDHQIAYNESSRSFHQFDAGVKRWRETTTPRLLRELNAWMEQRWGNRIPAPMLKKVLAEIQLMVPLWNTANQSGQLVVANGVLDFNGPSPLLQPRDNKRHFEHALDVAYQPDACCPRFQQFLREALDEADIRLIQKWVGALLAGPNKSQVVLVLVGNAGTGKGTLVNLLMQLVGVERTAELRVEHFNVRFELSAFLGKRLLVAPEIPAQLLSLKGVGRLKALVGQDRMEAELKTLNRRVQFKGDFHVVLHGNRLEPQPWSPDVDAFRRRLLIVDYARSKPSKVVPDLADHLWNAEGEGILQWAVEGVRLYLADIASSGSVTLTGEQQARIDRIIPPPPSEQPSKQPGQTPTAAVEFRWLKWLRTKLQQWRLRFNRPQQFNPNR